MDWIKQIIECKKENWVSPGSLGQKIKKIRMLRKYTQKELGVMCGFSFSSADVRIAQYEKNKKIPREKILKDMCNALGVGEGALIHADMLSYQEMFYFPIRKCFTHYLIWKIFTDCARLRKRTDTI